MVIDSRCEFGHLPVSERGQLVRAELKETLGRIFGRDRMYIHFINVQTNYRFKIEVCSEHYESYKTTGVVYRLPE